MVLAALMPLLVALGGAARASGGPAPGPNSVVGFGGAEAVAGGSASNLPGPLVGIAATPDGNGYWAVNTAGQVVGKGSASGAVYGSLAGVSLSAPVLGMAATPDGGGYWLVAGDGGIFSFGNAAFHGSTGSFKLNQPVVAMGASPNAGGYWLAAADGGIFSFGNAAFFGSTGSMALNQPMVGMAATPSGNGYWLVAADGGIFAFGDAGFYGSTGSVDLNQPIVAMAASPSGHGYWLVAADGGIFTFGDAAFAGSGAGGPSDAPATAIAVRPGGGYWVAFSAEDPVTTLLGQQERLARLGYLPLSWGPAGFVWRWPSMTALLGGAWSAGQDGLVMQGAVRAFQSQIGQAMDGSLSGPQLGALDPGNIGVRNPNGYTYAFATQQVPQTMTVWHNGVVLERTLVNMGIPGRPTIDGTFPVDRRFRSRIMHGINPDGTPYADPTEFVAFFNGLEAVHYIARSTWGTPQSLGCIETPYNAAAHIYPYLTYGTLVTVVG